MAKKKQNQLKHKLLRYVLIVGHGQTTCIYKRAIMHATQSSVGECCTQRRISPLCARNFKHVRKLHNQ